MESQEKNANRPWKVRFFSGRTDESGINLQDLRSSTSVPMQIARDDVFYSSSAWRMSFFTSITSVRFLRLSARSSDGLMLSDSLDDLQRSFCLCRTNKQSKAESIYVFWPHESELISLCAYVQRKYRVKTSAALSWVAKQRGAIIWKS